VPGRVVLALVNVAVLELLDLELEMARRRRHLAVGWRVRLQPLNRDRVEGALLALQPVAGQVGVDDLRQTVAPEERGPVRHERRRLRPQVAPDETAGF